MTAHPQREPVPDLDAEQEVDFGKYWRLIAARWWLIVAGLVAGLIIGYLVALAGSTSTYKATAQVYLGEPLAPGSATPITSPPTTLGLISNLVDSEATARRVAAKVGLKASRLRGHITTKPIVGITLGKIGTPAPLLAITVDGSPPAKIAAAANELASIVIAQVSAFTLVKIQTLRDRLAFDSRRLASVVQRLGVATRQVQELLNVRGLNASEKLIASLNLNNLLTYLESRQASLERDQLDARQALSLANNIELASVTSPAVAAKAAGSSSRTGAAIGGLIGLILGIVAALLWDPLTARTKD
jgi:capsular polysaccharide biosynthesis protein